MDAIHGYGWRSYSLTEQQQHVIQLCVEEPSVLRASQKISQSFLFITPVSLEEQMMAPPLCFSVHMVLTSQRAVPADGRPNSLFSFLQRNILRLLSESMQKNSPWHPPVNEAILLKDLWGGDHCFLVISMNKVFLSQCNSIKSPDVFTTYSLFIGFLSLK